MKKIKRKVKKKSREQARVAIVKAKVGRPAKYPTSQLMEVRIKDYFKDWANQDRKDPYTPVGLRVHLGLVDSSMKEYAAKPEFALLIKKSMDMIEADLTTKALRQRISPVAWIFMMKNIFGWQDKQDVQNTLTLDLGDKLRDALKGVSKPETKVLEQQGGSEG